jgi:hypothetical protein
MRVNHSGTGNITQHYVNITMSDASITQLVLNTTDNITFSGGRKVEQLGLTTLLFFAQDSTGDYDTKSVTINILPAVNIVEWDTSIVLGLLIISFVLVYLSINVQGGLSDAIMLLLNLFAGLFLILTIVVAKYNASLFITNTNILNLFDTGIYAIIIIQTVFVLFCFLEFLTGGLLLLLSVFKKPKPEMIYRLE